MIRPDVPDSKDKNDVKENPVQSAVLRELFQDGRSRDGSGPRSSEQLSLVALKAEDDPKTQIAQLRKESDEILNKGKPDYAKAAELLKKELELLKKLHPDAETSDFIKPNAGLGRCLAALSKGGGSKEADEYFAKALKLIDANPKTDAQEERDQEVFKFSILQRKGNNNRELAVSATESKVQDSFNTKAETDFTEALAALQKGLTEKQFEESGRRLNTLISLAIVEDALGKKESSAKHVDAIKAYPEYDDDIKAKIDSGIAMNSVFKALEKSATLKGLLRDMKTDCPWGPMMTLSMRKEGPAPWYDAKTSQMIISSATEPKDIPQSFAFAAAFGMKQGLSKLYGGDEAPDEKTYKGVQLDRFVAAYQAQAQAAKDQGVKATIVDREGTGHDLNKLKEEDLRAIIGKLESFEDHCEKGYSGLVLHFDANKKILTERKLLKKGY
jgi:hypothetical protein